MKVNQEAISQADAARAAIARITAGDEVHTMGESVAQIAFALDHLAVAVKILAGETHATVSHHH